MSRGLSSDINKPDIRGRYNECLGRGMRSTCAQRCNVEVFSSCIRYSMSLLIQVVEGVAVEWFNHLTWNAKVVGSSPSLALKSLSKAFYLHCPSPPMFLRALYFGSSICQFILPPSHLYFHFFFLLYLFIQFFPEERK